jgi:hypothetical protein
MDDGVVKGRSRLPDAFTTDGSRRPLLGRAVMYSLYAPLLLLTSR